MHNRGDLNSADQDNFSALPEDIKCYMVANFFSYREMKALVSTSRLWAHTLSGNAEKFYRFHYPKKHAQKSLPQYRKLVGPVDWQFELLAERQKLNEHFTSLQIPNYLNIRNCRLQGIKKILESKNGLKEIFVKDNEDKTIFHYLAEYQGEDKQTIYDLLFIHLQNNFCKKTSYTNTNNTKKYVNESILLLETLIEGGGGPKPGFKRSRSFFLHVKIVICNQLEFLKDINPENYFPHLVELLAIALNFNQEEIFFYLLSKITDFSQIWTKLTASIHLEELNLSANFERRLFDFLKKSGHYPKDSDTAQFQLLKWAIVLNQIDFIDSTHARNLLKINYKNETHFSLAVRKPITLYQKMLAISSEEVGEKSHLSLYPLRQAIKVNHVELVAFICDQPISRQRFSYIGMEEAVKVGNLDCLIVLARAYGGMRVDEVYNALQFHQFHILKYIEKTDPQLIDQFIQTPLGLSRYYLGLESSVINVNVIKFLILHNADLTLYGPDANNYLHKVSWTHRDNTASIELLITNGVDVNARTNNEYGATAIELAAKAYCKAPFRSFPYNLITLAKMGANPKLKGRKFNQSAFTLLEGCRVEIDGEFKKLNQVLLDYYKVFQKNNSGGVQERKCVIQ